MRKWKKNNVNLWACEPKMSETSERSKTSQTSKNKSKSDSQIINTCLQTKVHNETREQHVQRTAALTRIFYFRPIHTPITTVNLSHGTTHHQRTKFKISNRNGTIQSHLLQTNNQWVITFSWLNV